MNRRKRGRLRGTANCPTTQVKTSRSQGLRSATGFSKERFTRKEESRVSGKENRLRGRRTSQKNEYVEIMRLHRMK